MLFFYSLLVTVLIPSIISVKIYTLSDEFIDGINKQQSLWKAARHPVMEEYILEKTFFPGTIRSKIDEYRHVIRRNHDESKDVPESFDSRQQWPECADIIGLIQDQSKCDACWAFAAAEVMSDRICIHSNATKKLLVSAQDIITCTSGGSCENGTILTPWSKWISLGYVTGGLYNTTDQGCKSYFLPPCNDHPHKCIDFIIDTPECANKCDDPELDYDSQKTYGQGEPIVVSGEKQLQLEILTNGPVSGSFSVYTDFGAYESGIYYHVNGTSHGTHGVKIFGWGIENGTKYWLVANSWNDSWGENGFFRILRGANECDIEHEAIAALPDLTRF